MENWIAITGFEDYYEVSDLGNVRRLPKQVQNRGAVYVVPGGVLKPGKAGLGYLKVSLSKHGAVSAKYVHRLVALHFIPNPDNKPTVNHKDGNKLNNAKSNLEWATQAENNQHSYDTGLKIPITGSWNNGVKNPASKLTPEQVEQIRSLKGQKTVREIGRMFGVSDSLISQIQNFKKWI